MSIPDKAAVFKEPVHNSFGKSSIMKTDEERLRRGVLDMNNSKLGMIAFVLVIIGGVNWGLVGLLNLDLVAKLFGDMSTLTKIIYDLVGLSALYLVFTRK